MERMLVAMAIPCPICEAPARVLDGSPGVEWLVIEGCGGGGYRIRADLVATRRLKKLAPAEANVALRRRHDIGPCLRNRNLLSVCRGSILARR